MPKAATVSLAINHHCLASSVTVYNKRADVNVSAQVKKSAVGKKADAAASMVEAPADPPGSPGSSVQPGRPKAASAAGSLAHRKMPAVAGAGQSISEDAGQA